MRGGFSNMETKEMHAHPCAHQTERALSTALTQPNTTFFSPLDQYHSQLAGIVLRMIARNLRNAKWPGFPQQRHAHEGTITCDTFFPS